MATIETFAIPSRLYRYRPLAGEGLERVIGGMENGYVFCPTYLEMNDPMEGQHRVSALLSESRSSAVTIADVEETRDQLGIAAFSETYQSEPMWAHYADKFKGICIAYSLKMLMKGLGDDHAFVRMAYNEKAPALLKNSQTAAQRARMILSTKTVRWASEREWRLIRPARGKAEYQPEACITRIYLGSLIEALDQEAIVRVARSLKIPVSKMEIDTYALTFKTISGKKKSQTK